jgi:tRNA(Ile)-lysidine synthase
VLSHIRRAEILRAGERVGVAVSGGIDSVALLRLLLELRGELGIVLSVVHFNHKLRGAESDGDQEFVAGLARQYDLEFVVDSDDVAGHAAQQRISFEAAARELRYGFFRHLLRGPQGQKPDSENLPSRGSERQLFHGDGRSRGSSIETTPEATRDSKSMIPDIGEQESKSLGFSTLDKILTGHTLDDQAETVLMRLIRGAGLRGLRGIHPRILVEGDEGEVSGEIARPLLANRRRELEQYLKEIGQAWREDSTNAEDHFTRNRIRKLVVPLLEREFNPTVAENLAELAEIARGEEDFWENEISGWLGTTVQWSEPDWARAVPQEASLVQIAPHAGPTADGSDSGLRLKIDRTPWLVMNASVGRPWFLSEPAAVQRRLVKAIGENAGIPLEFKHVEEILRTAAEDSSSPKDLSLPLGWKLERRADELVFVTPDLREPAQEKDYEYELQVPGKVNVYEAGLSIEARRVPAGVEAAYNPDHLLDAESLLGPLKVRNWRAGDRFWPAHTKSPKKIKELLQERHVAQAERRSWPVVASGDEIVWVKGFVPLAKLRASPGRQAIVIVDNPLATAMIPEE